MDFKKFLQSELMNKAEQAKFQRYDFYLAILHWLGLVLVFLFNIFPEFEEYRLNHRVLYAYLAVGALFTLVYHHLLPKRFIGRQKLLLESNFDILAIALLMWLTWGHSSLFFFFYFMVIPGSALIFGRRRVFYETILISFLLLSIFGLDIQYREGVAQEFMPHLVHVTILLFFLWIVAFWSSSLAAILEKVLGEEKALTLKNKELYEREVKGRRELLAIQETSATLLSNLNLDQVLKKIVEGITKGLGYDRAAIFLVNKEEKTIQGKYTNGISEELAKKMKIPLSKGEGILFETIWQGRPFIVQNLFADLEMSEKLARLKPYWTSKLATLPIVSRLEAGHCGVEMECQNSKCPLYYKDSHSSKIPLVSQKSQKGPLSKAVIEKTVSCPMFKVFGAIVVDNFKSKRPITKENITALEVFAQNAAIAIENATLYEAQKKEVRQKRLKKLA